MTDPQPQRFRRAAILNGSACLLLLVTPLVVFVQHHRYPLLSADVGLFSAAMVAVSILLGAIAARWPSFGAVILAALVALFVDVQFTRATIIWIVGVFAGVTLLLYFLRARGVTLLVAVTSTILLTSVATALVRGPGSPAVGPPGRSDLPLVVHLILDEQIGIEGIPQDLVPGLASELRAALARRGFMVFGGAYSQFFNSHLSISHLVNFVHAQAQPDLVVTARRPFPLMVQRNAYFDIMAARGYRVRALLPDYLGLCPASARSQAVCEMYGATLMEALQNMRMPGADRARLLFRSYQERVTVLSLLREQYERARNAWTPDEGGTSVSPPVVRMSTVAADRALTQFTSTLSAAQPGDLLLAHLLLPHYPYVFAEDCQMLPVRDWVYRLDPEAPPGHSHTPAGRAERYQAYAAQVRCVERRTEEALDAIPAALRDRAVVIIQGDHGSRLGLRDPVPDQADLFSETDLIDAYSTLFAIRAPGLPADYDSHPAAIPCLLQAFVEAEFRDRDGVEACGGSPRVYLAGPDGSLVERALPEFHGGDRAPDRRQ